MLGTFFKPEFINVNLESTDKDELFEEMVELFVRGGAGIDRAAVLDSLFLRETKMTTGIMPGVAIPHAVCPGIEGAKCAVGVSRAGIEYGSLDGKPVHIVFMLLFGEHDTELHLKILQKLSLILQNEEVRNSFINFTNPQELYEALCKDEEDLA